MEDPYSSSKTIREMAQLSKRHELCYIPSSPKRHRTGHTIILCEHVLSFLQWPCRNRKHRAHTTGQHSWHPHEDAIPGRSPVSWREVMKTDICHGTLQLFGEQKSRVGNTSLVRGILNWTVHSAEQESVWKFFRYYGNLQKGSENATTCVEMPWCGW